MVFNDLSGYGNCSLMAAIPVLTAMGVRVHPVPTAVLTRQTGYDRYSMEDLTGFMPQFTADWQEVQPDGIITGFLSNPAQGDCIADFLAVHRTTAACTMGLMKHGVMRCAAWQHRQMCSRPM